jgi:hypothetical protein
MRTAVFSILLTLLAALLPGCIDADPSTFPGVDAGLDARTGVADTASDVDPHAACRACLEAPEDPGPGCGGRVAACMADARCPLIYECGFERGCWSLTTQMEVVSCGLPCFVAAGVTNLGDPVVTLVTDVLGCVLGQCQPACGANP